MVKGKGVKREEWLGQMEDVYASEEVKKVVKGKGTGFWKDALQVGVLWERWQVRTGRHKGYRIVK